MTPIHPRGASENVTPSCFDPGACWRAALPAFAEPKNPGEIEEGPYVPGEVVVLFKPGADAEGIANAYGATVKEEGALGVKVLSVPEGAVPHVVFALSHNPNVEYAEPNYIATTFIDPERSPDTTYSDSSARLRDPMGLGQIQAYQAWDVTTGGTAVKVAVVDTGIDNSHPNLPPSHCSGTS
jgi:thermitase